MNRKTELNNEGLILVSGPTNSGKSLWAEKILSSCPMVVYIATSCLRENDKEWDKRISKHRNRRPKSWRTVEYPLDLSSTINNIPEKESILIDSLGGIVENYLMQSLTSLSL